MFKFITSIALVSGLAYAALYAFVTYLNAKVTPQKVNAQEVDPKVFEWFMFLKGYDADACKVWRDMYENGQLKVDENGMLI